MADEKKDKQMLMPDMSPAKKAMLVQTAMTPGFKVIIEMANEAALRATQDISRLDPEGPDYERKVVERGRRARNINEGFDLLFASVYGHVDSIKKVEAKEDQEAEDAVGAIYGIHPAVKGTPVDAIQKTFGIHPARPKKAAAQQ